MLGAQMNLDLYPIGWVHFVASLVALAAGAVVLVRPKGTPVHRVRGRVYVVALVITSITALGIYRSGVFFFPHWFGIAALVAVALSGALQAAAPLDALAPQLHGGELLHADRQRRE